MTNKAHDHCNKWLTKHTIIKEQ